MIIPEPSQEIRRIVFLIVQNTWFDISSFLLIIVNTIILGVNFSRNDTSVGSYADIVNEVYLALFHVEVLFKIIAWGGFYFKDSWNR